jgi:hypothetical protein
MFEEMKQIIHFQSFRDSILDLFLEDHIDTILIDAVGVDNIAAFLGECFAN